MQRFKRRNSKRKAQRKHLSRRLWERFGVQYTQQLESEWVRLIKQGRVRMIDKQSNRVSVYEIPIRNGDDLGFAHAVYDKERKSIVTVLYPEGAVL